MEENLKSLLLIALAATSFLSAEVIDISKYPTLGDPKAPVQIVAFLEPKCPDSKRYHKEVFPKVQSEFIKTNQASYSVVITSFISNSMPAAIALLCVYHQGPSKLAPKGTPFFKYLDSIYQNQPPKNEDWATIDNLLKFAVQASPAIFQARLKKCVEGQEYKKEIEDNTEFGNKLMGRLSTPSIYVDGQRVNVKADSISFDDIKNAVAEALKAKENTKTEQK